MDLEGMGVARLLSDAASGAASPVLAGAGQVGTLSCVSCCCRRGHHRGDPRLGPGHLAQPPLALFRRPRSTLHGTCCVLTGSAEKSAREQRGDALLLQTTDFVPPDPVCYLITSCPAPLEPRSALPDLSRPRPRRPRRQGGQSPRGH